MLNHNKAYDFNLETLKPDKKQKGELLVDLKIDGLKGPIPKVIHPKTKKNKVWADGAKDIEEFEMTADQLKEVIELKQYGEKKEEVAASQILLEQSSQNDAIVENSVVTPQA